MVLFSLIGCRIRGFIVLYTLDVRTWLPSAYKNHKWWFHWVFRYNFGEQHESSHVLIMINTTNTMADVISSWRYREYAAGLVHLYLWLKSSHSLYELFALGKLRPNKLVLATFKQHWSWNHGPENNSSGLRLSTRQDANISRALTYRFLCSASRSPIQSIQRQIIVITTQISAWIWFSVSSYGDSTKILLQ